MSTSTFSYGTVAGSSYGMTISPAKNDERPKTPSGLIVTQAVQTRVGWLGQVIVDKEIIWESAPDEDGEAAVGAANDRVVEALKHLFWRVADAVGEGPL
jgi:hypothetical protein